MRKIDLRSKFAILFIIFTLLTGGLGFFGYATLKRELFVEQLSLNQTKTEALAERIDRWLSTRKTEVNTLANTPVIRAMDWQESGPFLKQKHIAMPWFYIFAQINQDGSYYNSKVDFAEGQNLSDRAHFKASIGGKVYASDPVVSRTLGTDIVAITSPIYSSDEKGADILGVFGGMIDTSTIVDELGRFENGPSSYAFAVNSSGIAISHPDEARRGNINTKATSLLDDADQGLNFAVQKMLTGNSGWEKISIDGQLSYLTYTPIAEADWYIASVTSADFIDGQFKIVDYASAMVAMIIMMGLFMIWRFRRLEVDALSRQRQVSEEKSQAKSVFLASMSHELRTPLNAIIGYSQILLAKRSVDEETRKTLSLVLNSGRHLLMLINRVLDLSKIEAGKLEIEARAVNPKSLFGEWVQIFDLERAKYSSEFIADIADDLPTSILIDPDKLAQVVTNLVVNAFKYGDRSDVYLRVSHLADEKALRIEVEDQGKGMSEEQLSRLFLPFEQVNNKSDGAGLGMSIVNELLQLMGGSINVDSVLGEGTHIVIELPYGCAVGPSIELSNRTRLPIGIVGDAKPHVLVVDDHEQNRQYLSQLLAPLGFKLSFAEDGQDALQFLGSNPPDLVITDLVMPRMDGFELIAHIRNTFSSKELPIIVASASAFSDDQVRSLSLGANSFIPKPIDAFGMLAHVANLCSVQLEEDLQSSNESPISFNIELNWSDEKNIVLRESILLAASLGQLQKIEQLLETIEDPKRKENWLRLLQDALQDHDDEKITDILGSINA